MSVVDDIVVGREQMKNAIFGPAFRLLPRKEGTMNVYPWSKTQDIYNAEIYWGFIDEANGNKYPRVIRSVALLPTNLSKNIGIRSEAPKPAKFTAEELRKIEDAVKKEIDEKDELRQAIAYAYLNGLGWRMTKAQHVIDKALE